MYIDTHAHLNYDNKYGDLNLLLGEMHSAGVHEAVIIGWDFASSNRAKELACEHQELYFAAGIHPSDTAKAKAEDWRNLPALLSHEKAVAVGETGLDYHYDETNKKEQKRAFAWHLELARDFKLPVIIHSRDAAEDTLALLKQNREKLSFGGVMHCFSGSAETAKEYLKLGLYISFAGPVTFKNARKLDEVARIIPSDRILSETDCPYLAPEPYRGSLNTPKNIPFIVQRLAEIRNESVDKIAQNIYNNAHALFYKMKKDKI